MPIHLSGGLSQSFAAARMPGQQGGRRTRFRGKRMSKEFLRVRPGLYCIELRTANWPASVEWYRQVLGLRVLVRVVDDGYALLEAG